MTYTRFLENSRNLIVAYLPLDRRNYPKFTCCKLEKIMLTWVHVSTKPTGQPQNQVNTLPTC